MRVYDFDAIFYANGPGSFMSIKISYIILQTISIIKNIPFYATDGFYFNQNNPIKAFGNVVFVKKDGKITTFKNYNGNIASFSLPKKLDFAIFCNDVEPMYILPAV